jgi:hypothetical protein
MLGKFMINPRKLIKESKILMISREILVNQGIVAQ